VNLYNNHISAWSTTYYAEGKEFPLYGEARNSFAWDARMMASVKLPWSLSFQGTGRYSSKSLTAQGSRQGGWSVDLALRKNLGDWSFSLNCRDVFDSRKFKSTVDGIGYTQYDERWRGGRNISLTIKYAFGNMKAKLNTKHNDEEPTDGSGYAETEY
ncbi:MAG: outer membrane beta-barrel family protein, partial [Muribaculaceae bacterium]|nr:outer membrane beta-barrel family protein [Muribaculaceae bacterium]